MVVEVAVGERFDADVDVGFGGSEEEMAEERFEDEGVGALFVHVGGVGVTEAVGSEVVSHGLEALAEAGFFGGGVDDAIDGAGGEVEDLVG